MIEASVRVLAHREIAPIDSRIYSHFIEHLGPCIYGGIWSEMLKGRKFEDGDADGDGLAEPWLALGPGEYAPETSDPLSGSRSQRVSCRAAQPFGIAQAGLTVLAGQTYRISLWLRGEWAEAGVAAVLRDGASGAELARCQWKGPEDQWSQLKGKLPASAGSTEAVLELVFSGPGDLSIDAVSLMPAEARDGLRPDVVQAVRALKPRVLRYPGGCFSDGYHWRDGIGDRDHRPQRFDPAWKQPEPNDFGTDEFMSFCRAIGAEPYINVNLGSGTPEEAAAWVEYCNGSADTPMGQLRAANGCAEPYAVRYWGVGNEICYEGEIGHCSAEEYAERYQAFAAAMKAVDLSIELVAVGTFANPRDWNRRFLEALREPVERPDYLSVHLYVPGAKIRTEDPQRAYWSVCAGTHVLERELDAVVVLLDDLYPTGRRPALALDEWNTWYDAGPEAGWVETYGTVDGLFAADLFRVLHRFGDRMRMANVAQLVNTLGIIQTEPDYLRLTPQYRVMELLAEHGGTVCVEAQVESPSVEVVCPESWGDMAFSGLIPLVTAGAMRSSDGRRLSLLLINRDPAQEALVDLSVEGFRGGYVHEHRLEAASAFAACGPGGPSALPPRTRELDGEGFPSQMVLPPHSVVLLEANAE